ncbi:hypothetical protein BO94DRAFT_273520 [Aspergillus sclerotioniger CBS 115572]|uniref:Uncharacterized protein n=1 Tax=Aspergillus sclerotioniger CBS 115572 TaxID=1450535 RepID=A0A317X745_9EURO|nr:hypothetical protein BO94DRAFT_273520 [Aspergillus sclerotioniger CBS 115572]PWY94413.1 hypothetical protein BO94DRAFT_273520 [Aspergillus sclerotioniger CBS 115572]
MPLPKADAFHRSDLDAIIHIHVLNMTPLLPLVSIYLYPSSTILPTPRRGLRLGFDAGPSVWRCTTARFSPLSTDVIGRGAAAPRRSWRPLLPVQNLPPKQGSCLDLRSRYLHSIGLLRSLVDFSSPSTPPGSDGPIRGIFPGSRIGAPWLPRLSSCALDYLAEAT